MMLLSFPPSPHFFQTAIRAAVRRLDVRICCYRRTTEGGELERACFCVSRGKSHMRSLLFGGDGVSPTGRGETIFACPKKERKKEKKIAWRGWGGGGKRKEEEGDPSLPPVFLLFLPPSPLQSWSGGRRVNRRVIVVAKRHGQTHVRYSEKKKQKQKVERRRSFRLLRSPVLRNIFHPSFPTSATKHKALTHTDLQDLITQTERQDEEAPETVTKFITSATLHTDN